MASKNEDEREHVNELIKTMLPHEPRAHVHIDRDAGGKRHTSSGWDFLITLGGKVVFVEAKEENEKLSSWQEFTQSKIKSADTPYRVLRFWGDGAFFTIDDGERLAISDARVHHFLEG